MRETVVAVEIYASVSFISTEPFSTPRIILILAFEHMIGSLEERLLDIKDTIDVEHGHNVESNILQQIDVVLIVVQDTVQELIHNIERHLDRDGLSRVVSTSD